MTTLKITIDNKKNAQLLKRLLNTMSFVINVEEVQSVSLVSNQFIILKKFFNAIEPDSLFTKINNPTEWQKNIRNEWDAH